MHVFNINTYNEYRKLRSVLTFQKYTKIFRPGQIRLTNTMFHRVRWIESFQAKKTVIVWRAIYLDKLEVFHRAQEISALTLHHGQEVEEEV